MKLSAWHKAQGDTVEWYSPMFSGHMDRVYMSKVFSFTPDYEYHVDADEVIKGGSGYCIELVNGKEIYHSERDSQLPYEIEHIYPDYSLYGITDTAYGFMSRGCPRGCDFCHVKAKEGQRAYKVSDLSEFWGGQKNIKLLDPNAIACKEWRDILQQLIDSKAKVDFTQGIDIRIMTEEKAEMLRQINVSMVHMAWDRYQDKDIVVSNLKKFAAATGWDRHKVEVYVLCNFDSTFEQDLERIYTIRDIGFQPYVMIYDKEHLPKNHDLRRLATWCNNPFVFYRCKRFEDYDVKKR